MNQQVGECLREYRDALNGSKDVYSSYNDAKNRMQELHIIYEKYIQIGVSRTNLEKIASAYEGKKAFLIELEKRQGVFNQKKAEREKYIVICNEHYRMLIENVKECERKAENSDNYKDTIELIKRVQLSAKSIQLTNEQRREIFEKLDKAYKTVIRIREDRYKKYNNECNNNYSLLKSQVVTAINIANTEKDFKNGRQKMIEIQNSIKNKTLSREQRDDLYGKMKDAFTILQRRQDKERADYEAQCKSNYINLHAKTNNAINQAAYSSDYKNSRDELKAVKSELFKAHPMRREQKDELLHRIDDAIEKINVKATSEREKREREFKDRIKENIRNLEDSLNKDRDSLRYQQDKLYSIRPGAREYEIKQSIREKMDSIQSRINSKESKISELRRRL